MLDFRDVDWRTEAEETCEGATPFGRATAHRIAEERRHRGEQVGAHRCPWGRSPHWHVGPLSEEDIERMAAAIRNRTNEPGDDA